MIIRIAKLVGLLHGLTAATALSGEQTVLSPGNFESFVRPDGNLPSLADLLTLEGRASIFFSYAREIDLSARFTQPAKEGEGTTVFVPTNKAVQALARKPHESPDMDTVDVSDATFDAISESNVQRWVGAHIVPRPEVDFTSPEPYDTLTGGVTITFHAIGRQPDRPEHEPIIDAEAAHPPSIKDSSLQVSFPNYKPVERFVDSMMDADAARGTVIKASELPTHDGAYLSSSEESVPIWTQYEMCTGAHIIARMKASNGVMYLIDGTVPV